MQAVNENLTGRLRVSIIWGHPDGSVSSEVFAPTWEQYLAIKELLGADNGPAYVRHIPADDIRQWAPKVGRLGVVL